MVKFYRMFMSAILLFSLAGIDGNYGHLINMHNTLNDSHYLNTPPIDFDSKLQKTDQQSITLSTFPLDVTIISNTLYIADGNDGLIVADISDINAPTVIGRYQIEHGGIRLFIEHNHAYVLSRNNTVFVVNIQDLEHLFLESTIHSVDPILEIGINETRFYIATVAGLELFDIRVPARPTLINTYDYGNIIAMDVGNPYISVIRQESDDSSITYSVDILDIQADTLEVIGRYSTRNTVGRLNIRRSIQGIGCLLYILDDMPFPESTPQLVVIDACVPQSPRFIGNYVDRLFRSAFLVSDHAIYLATGSALVILDASDPSHINQRCTLVSAPVGAFHFASNADVLAVAQGSQGLLLLSVRACRSSIYMPFMSTDSIK